MRSNEPMYDQIAELMKKRLNRNMIVLELACGTGMISERIAGCVKHLEATDYSAEMIAEAQKKFRPPQLHYAVQDASNLPYADGSFDAVVIANALHVMPEPDRAMREIRRVLKTNGMLFAPTFIHGEGVGFRLRTRLLEIAGFRTYHHWDGSAFLNYIRQHEFEPVHHEVMGSSIAPLCYVEAKK